MMKLKGFTLTELMIALAVLGIMSALVLPMLNNSMPSRNRMMMKKAYYAIEEVVRELINNDRYYPELGSDGNTYVGFDNTLNVCYTKPDDSTEGTVDGSGHLDISCQGLYKFPKLFAKQLNISGDMSDMGSSDFKNSVEQYKESNGGAEPPTAMLQQLANLAKQRGLSFVTDDGMIWMIEGTETAPAEVTAAGDTGLTQIITVDVNGDKSPNCYQGTGGGCETRTNDFDRFRLYVTRKGKIIPHSGQDWFEHAISIDSSVNGD